MNCEHNNTVGRVEIHKILPVYATDNKRELRFIKDSWMCGVCGTVSDDMLDFLKPVHVPGTE